MITGYYDGSSIPGPGGAKIYREPCAMMPDHEGISPEAIGRLTILWMP